ncbi:hypothetical protein M409DRAFT_16036 [Zasmidium cellare ATCC 36951]|uniref:Transcription factor IIIC putative zinc-finger domain-containing protein n=1 Tax=Zasmidium cellare ATCC 36951 TaxID=1080233 RepID=A0A6A6D3S6_ZASCE|nr:uncharacterized protein M409DRAFT_16036 [Zasmidium cellare ATCC 36951]KAF2173763.1 hypothetical protein M409DRAFT_16036 [Zasmidium cellare ATCC 36951]
MACTITIPFWPDSTDCLDWSPDNQIAVTGGEQIAILTPKLKETAPNGKLWNTTLLKVNAFTAKEHPLVDAPLSNINFSIGEELSLRQAIESKWSPSGLAIHKGCALAVLTANHVLSIWAPSGKSDVASNWARQGIVNDAVAEYYRSKDTARQHGTDDQSSQQQLTEQDRVRQRIRSFAWSPPLTRNGGDEEYYLAVSTEGADILFFRVTSPHSGTLTRPSKWELTVVGSLRLESDAENHPQVNVGGIRFAEYIAWGGWTVDTAGQNVARFAYVHAGRLFTSSVKRNTSAESSAPSRGLDIDDSRRVLGDRTDIIGPVRFVPGKQRGSLIAFGDDTVFEIDVDEEIPTARTHHLDDRWDCVSGVAFANPGDGSIVLHITSLLSMSNAATTTLSLPLEGNDTSVQPSWQHAISEFRATYGADHNLDSHVAERTSGIASSPLGDYVATCTTMHPSDCIEYVIGSEQKSLLSITLESESTEGHFLPAPPTTSSQPLSAEAILFSLSRRLEQNAESEEREIVGRDSLVAEILRYHQPSKDSITVDKSTLLEALGDDPKLLYRHIKQAIFVHPDVLTAQASRISGIALKPNITRSEVTRPVVQRLVQEFLKLTSQAPSSDSLSERIRTIFAVVNTKLSPPDPATVNGDRENDSENCTICQKSILFESLRWARCISGHQFSRCSLSFLPIQEPGTTKSCGICGLQYFNEKVLSDITPATEDIEMADVATTESNIDTPANDTWVEVSRNSNAFPQRTPSLAQILFAACDVCVYCGGKFVD